MAYRITSLDLPLVVMANGQSNMAASPPVFKGFSAITRHLGADLLGWDDTTAAFIPLIDVSANAKGQTYYGTVGPGGGQVLTPLARMIADATGRTIRTYALAYTGQPIAYFLPSSGTLAYYENGTQHGSLNNYNLLKSYVTASGVVPSWYFWLQGSANAGATKASYYTPLKTLFDATRVDYPGIRWLIIGSAGNDHDRIGVDGYPITGVRAAQRQLAAENPGTVLFADTSYMNGNTAYWGYENGAHYSDYAGYEEVAALAYATLIGESRPALTTCTHMIDAFAWSDFFLYNHGVDTPAPNMTLWQTDIAPGTNYMVPHTNAPLHVAYDEEFANRSCYEFDQGNSESCKITGLAATDDWTIWAAVKLDSNPGGQFVMMVSDAPSANRVGLFINGSMQFTLYEGGGSNLFTGGRSFLADLVGLHTYCLVISNTGSLATLYVDGEYYGERVLAGTTGMTEFWLGSLLGSSTLSGRVFAAGYARGILATANEAAAIHGGARAEFVLKN